MRPFNAPDFKKTIFLKYVGFQSMNYDEFSCPGSGFYLPVYGFKKKYEFWNLPGLVTFVLFI